nr:uncharacterized protein I203_04075 [Kwoniella mangroviensis CBS 8507]OCF66499.1 hypothetical protein I203_04075 [Kwoniella mangroviensis CBS 8507]
MPRKAKVHTEMDDDGDVEITVKQPTPPPTSPSTIIKGKSKSKSASGTRTPPPTGLRQRIKNTVDEISKETEELHVRLRKKDDGHYKLLAPGTPFNEIDLSESTFFRHDGHKGKPTWSSWLFGRKFVFPA